MEIFNIIIVIILIIGLVLILQIIIRDPIFIIKSFLRGLKNGNWQLKIAFFPIWGPIDIVDKLFNLRIFIDDFEDASIPFKINFIEYDKFFIISKLEILELEKIIRSFLMEFNINDAKIGLSNYESKIVIKIEHAVEFPVFFHLIPFIENSASNNPICSVKEIFLNRNNIAASFFIFPDPSLSSRLIGKNYKNEKLYLNLSSEIETD